MLKKILMTGLLGLSLSASANFDLDLLKQNMMAAKNMALTSDGIPNQSTGLTSAQKWSGIPGLEDSEKYMQAMKKLGFEPEKDALYIFLSFDMPEKLIKQYLKDAVASGASVIIKGMPAHMNDFDAFFPEFVRKFHSDINPNVQIDPRLFEVYEVNRVPTILYATKPSKDVCLDVYKNPTLYKDVELPMLKCVTEPEDSYMKMSGSVPVSYALEMFEEEGADVAHRREAMSQWYGLSEKSRLEKAQDAWSGYGEVNEAGAVVPHDFDVNTPYFLDIKRYQ